MSNPASISHHIFGGYDDYICLIVTSFNSENYRVIEHQRIDNDEIVEVFFKVSDSNNYEFIEDKFDKLS